jgi:hypothetical protein
MVRDRAAPRRDRRRPRVRPRPAPPTTRTRTPRTTRTTRTGTTKTRVTRTTKRHTTTGTRTTGTAAAGDHTSGAGVPARSEGPADHDRQGHLRSPTRRDRVQAQPQAPAPDPHPEHLLHRARMRPPGRPLRPGPYGRLAPRRPHLRMRNRPSMPAPPPGETGPGLAARSAGTRCPDLAYPRRPDLRHHPHPVPAIALRGVKPSTSPDRSPHSALEAGKATMACSASRSRSPSFGVSGASSIASARSLASVASRAVSCPAGVSSTTLRRLSSACG